MGQKPELIVMVNPLSEEQTKVSGTFSLKEGAFRAGQTPVLEDPPCVKGS
jgi:hypothetical protein